MMVLINDVIWTDVFRLCVVIIHWFRTKLWWYHSIKIEHV